MKNIVPIQKIFLSVLASIVLVGCGQTVVPTETTSKNTTNLTNNSETQVPASAKILVTSSIIPLSSIINTVGGEFVEVNNIVPAGVSPHGFDISAQQMMQVENSQIAFLTGLEHIDGFLEKATEGNTKIHLADGIDLIESSGHEHHDEEEKHEDDEDEHEGHDDDEHQDHDDHNDEEHDKHDEDAHNTDPHVWLGKGNIILISQKVRDELTTLVPEQAEYFAKNTAKFETELSTIYADFASQTEGKTPREFIVFHDAYNYLMQSVGMNFNLKVPFSQNILQESGTAHMKELIEEVELHGIKHVFKEPQFSDTNLQSFVNEYNLELGTLDPLGTDASAGGYLENIRANLLALSKVYE